MQPGRASVTASQAALLRAVHLAVDHPPILNDHLAGPLCGLSDQAAVLKALQAFRDRLKEHGPDSVAEAWLLAARMSVVVRAVWVEEQILKAVEREGLSQYVILGAGLDSFAYRYPRLGSVLRIFEVDYPATQAFKRERLGAVGITPPAHVTYVPIDFERDSLLQVLEDSGYRRDVPARFSWLGVALYLTAAAINRMLGQVASAAAGSEIMLNYVVPPRLLSEEDRQVLGMLRSLLAGGSEPGISFFDPAEIQSLAQSLGFTEVSHLGPKDSTARYLGGRTDGLKVSGLVHLLRCRV